MDSNVLIHVSNLGFGSPLSDGAPENGAIFCKRVIV